MSYAGLNDVAETGDNKKSSEWPGREQSGGKRFPKQNLPAKNNSYLNNLPRSVLRAAEGPRIQKLSGASRAKDPP